MSRFPIADGPIELSNQGPVRLRGYRTGANTMSLELGIDYEKAEVPDRLYYADYADVRRGRVGVNLIFARLETNRPQLRTQVEISFPDEQFQRQLWSNSRGLHETVRKMLHGKMPPGVEKLGEAEKVQTLRSNNVFMALLGEEAEMDFYDISPGDIHFVTSKKRKEVHLEAVIRIALNASVLFEFLERCRPVAEELEKVPGISYDEE